MVPTVGPIVVPTVGPIVVPITDPIVVPPMGPTTVPTVVSSMGTEAVPTMVPPHMFNINIKIDDHKKHPGASYHHIQKTSHAISDHNTS